jgi:hypothetical protein
MARCILFALVWVGLWSHPSRALAWVGTSIQSSVTVVEVLETGSAKVSHEWLFRVRGGPLKSLTVDGVDSDAQLLNDATVTRAVSGAVAGPPIPVSGERDGRSLYLTMGNGKGLPSGGYLLKFSYITDLDARGMIRSSGTVAELDWQSPTYPEGIDSLKVSFFLRRAAVPPRVAGAPVEGAQGGPVQLVATDKGVFLAELRRESEADILTLTRPHVARQEAVTWRLEVDPSAVGMARKPSERGETPIGVLPVAQAERFNTWPYGIASALALAFCGLVFWKLRSSGTAPLVKLRLSHRLVITGICLWGSVWCALVPEWPTIAALLLLTAAVLTLSRPDLHVPPARGPGVWKSVKSNEIVVGNERVGGGTRWLDVATLPGCSLFCAIVGGAVLLSMRMIGVAPYYSAMALLYAMAFVPIFFSLGKSRHSHPVLEQFEFLRPMLKRVPKALADSSLIARYPDGSEFPDEVRMVVSPSNVKAGLRSCEVAVEHAQGMFGRIMTPALLFRVEEHSLAHQALPREGQWSRGRDSSERILVMRPSLPLRTVTLDLLRQTLTGLAIPKTRHSTKSKGTRARTSSGGALMQSKALHPIAPR